MADFDPIPPWIPRNSQGGAYDLSDVPGQQISAAQVTPQRMRDLAAANAAPADLSVSPDMRGQIFGTPAATSTQPAGRAGIVQFWMAQGVPQHVAEGIADRVNVESGYRPTAWNPNDMGSPSGGLYQHHADRLTRLKQYAAAQGKPWTDPGVQNQFALNEVQGGDPIATKHWQEILAAPDRQTAEALWTRYFERGVPSPGSVRLGGRFGAMGPRVGSLDAALAAAPTPAPAAASAASPPAQAPLNLQVQPAAAPQQTATPAASTAPTAARPATSLQPIPIPPAPNLHEAYQKALAAILNGQRRPFDTIFG